MELEKTIKSFKRYINSQEQKLDDYYRMDEEFYKDEIEQLELSLKLLRTVLNHITKQEKMIDTIITELAYYDNYICHSIECKDIGCKKCLKQYFEKKAEESE